MAELSDHAALDLQAENARLSTAIEAERATRTAAERRADSYEAQLVERWLAERPGQHSAEEQAWIRNNRRYVLDPDFHNRVVQAHREATGNLKLPRGTPESRPAADGLHGRPRREGVKIAAGSSAAAVSPRRERLPIRLPTSMPSRSPPWRPSLLWSSSTSAKPDSLAPTA